MTSAFTRLYQLGGATGPLCVPRVSSGGGGYTLGTELREVDPGGRLANSHARERSSEHAAGGRCWNNKSRFDRDSRLLQWSGCCRLPSFPMRVSLKISPIAVQGPPQLYGPLSTASTMSDMRQTRPCSKVRATSASPREATRPLCDRAMIINPGHAKTVTFDHTTLARLADFLICFGPR
jgi:hypothetical protein